MFESLAKEKIFFTQHLFLMLKGGMPISEALEVLKAETKSKYFKKALNDILKRVLAGESLHKSFANYPKIFDRFYQSIIKTGEESGTLERNLEYLALQLRSEYEIKRKISGALIYPAIVILLALVISLFVILYVLPKVTNLFQILAIELPLATRILIKTATFLQQQWLFLIGLIIFLTIFFRMIFRIKSLKFYFDKISLSLPIVGPIQKDLNLSRFAQNFSTLLQSGMPILECLEICLENLPNEFFKRNLLLVKSEVERGGKISQGLKKIPKIFPLTFSQMIAVGETSGSLEESYLYLSKFYQEEVDSALKNLSNLLEPILLIFVGIFVAFVALAIITPIYRFTGAMKIR